MSSVETTSQPLGGRWMQLVIGIVCMAMVANLQYGWTLFVKPIQAKHGWDLSLIQIAFTIFIVTETWLVPVEGWFVDKFGPKIVVIVGGILCALAWMVNSIADSLFLLYLGAALGGIGAGAVYGTCVGNALKWFPDRRGLAAGLTAAGFGAGSAITIIPIANMIASSGYEHTFMVFGLIQGGIVLVLGFLLAKPNTALLPKPAANSMQSRRDYGPMEMVKTPVFWVMYALFVLVAAGGLVVTAQIAPIAKDWQIADVPVSMMGLTLPALTFALAIDRILNGVTRPFFGWVSDHIGRENTMFICFALEAVGIVLMWEFGHDPIAFTLLTGLVFFAWGEIYSLFPATCADTFGSKFAATNAGLLYTAKGTASFLVPVASIMYEASGSWEGVFYAAAAVNALAAIVALFVLKPMRARTIREAKANTVQTGVIQPAE
ncbi:oxalate/formate MFS antiporter [Terrihabitans rhizophilus]|uniref:Oxalate/formate MFS antiporter n=1 Tax=Terrihabitans rhizophilus TaxID=3092662 RepID=A0ABU4RJN2_9HYPH|nr:oxalate/formate MFS antiporter [Terrihabitans sp. PJ23]MDX6805064.1 oxalate/formate MFS antiporter [Terrihabitans sp. PJ23]